MIDRCNRLLRQLEEGLMVALVLAMILLAVSQIVLRNVFASGLLWADPVLRVMVLWVGLLGAMVATRNRQHINVDVLSHFLAPRFNLLLQRVVALLSAVVCLLLAWHAGRFVLMEREDGALLANLLPVWWCEAIMPFAFAVMGLRFLLQAAAPAAVDHNANQEGTA